MSSNLAYPRARAESVFRQNPLGNRALLAAILGASLAAGIGVLLVVGLVKRLHRRARVA